MNTKPQKIGQTIQGAGIACSMLFAFAWSATPARANTYMFSFTAQQVLDAVQQTHRDESGPFTGSALYRESSYFGIWLQPDAASVASFSYVSSESPTASGWETNVITDPSDLPPGPFVGYRMIQGTATNYNVTVLSGANGGAAGNIFMNATFHDTDLSPLGWGPVQGRVNQIMDPSAVFQFTISTAEILSGTAFLNGQASELRSSSTSSFIPDKVYPVQFSLEATVTQTSTVPEPGSASYFGLGAAILLGSAISKKIRSTGKKSS